MWNDPKLLPRNVIKQSLLLFLISASLTGLFIFLRAYSNKNQSQVNSRLSVHPYSPTPIPETVKHFIHSDWVFTYTNLESIAKEADLIVLGTVSSVEKGRSVVDASGKVTVPYYNAKITLDAVLTSGGLREPGNELRSVTLEVMGDPEDKTTLWEEVPIYKVGERYLLFLGKMRGSSLYETMTPQGRFQLIDGRVYPVTERNSWDKFWGQEESTFIKEILQSLSKK